jgi:hypothetical protein
MGVAFLYSKEPEKGGPGQGKASETEGISSTRLSNARAVLRYSRVLAEAVRDGTKKRAERSSAAMFPAVGAGKAPAGFQREAGLGRGEKDVTAVTSFRAV